MIIYKVVYLNPLCIKLGCIEGDIRLVSINSPLQGRVELCYDGVWATVCGRLWNYADAAVVCRQLGYSSSGMVIYQKFRYVANLICCLGAVARVSAFGQGTGPILMSDVVCRGTEKELSQCPHNSFDFSCSHFEDAGVECVAG